MINWQEVTHKNFPEWTEHHANIAGFVVKIWQAPSERWWCALIYDSWQVKKALDAKTLRGAKSQAQGFAEATRPNY